MAWTIASSDTVTGVVGAVGSFVGVIVGGLVTLKVARENQKGAQQAELTRALAGYMQATQLVAIELASMPKPTIFGRRRDERPSGPAQFFFNRLLARIIFGRRHDDIRDRYHRARAEVVLIAPAAAMALVREIDHFFNEWEQNPGSDMSRGWGDLSDRLRLTAQNTVDEGHGRPHRAGDPAIDATARS